MIWRRVVRPELGIPLLAIALRWVPGPRVIDDAYIIFRYVQNLLAGDGLVYNPGEPVFGITSPLWALALAAFAGPAGGVEAPFPILALGLGALADALTCWLLIRLATDLHRRAAGIVTAMIWAAAPMSVTFAIGGMETSLFILLMAATLYFHSSGRHVAAAIGAGLSTVTRPDALIFVGLFVLERARQLWRRRRAGSSASAASIPEVAGLLLPGAAWAVAAWASYGSPLPHSVVAKASAYFLPPEAAFVRLLQHYSTPFLEHLVLGTGWVPVGLVLYLLLFALGAADVIRRRPTAWPLFAYPVAYFILFSAANPLIFRWYLAPPLPALFLGIFIGAQRLSADVKRPRSVWVFGAAAFLLTLNGWTLRPETGPLRPTPQMAYVGLEEVYLDLGDRLRGVVEEEEVVAAGDIGALGFASGARMLDLVGLVSPQIDDYYPLDPSAYVTNYAVPAGALLDLKPDYVVLLEVYGRRTVLRDAGFLHAYRLIETVPTTIYGSQGMLVFRRMEAP